MAPPINPAQISPVAGRIALSMFNYHPDSQRVEQRLKAELESAHRTMGTAGDDTKPEARREYLRALRRFANLIGRGMHPED